jgi:hypothetical protein
LFSIFTFQSGISSFFTRFSDLRSLLGSDTSHTEFAQTFSTQAEELLLPSSFIQWSAKISPSTNIQAVGHVLYTYYFYFFLVASLILLVAMVGAIVLTMHKGVRVKRQEIYEQNNREFSQTIQKIRPGRLSTSLEEEMPNNLGK